VSAREAPAWLEQELAERDRLIAALEGVVALLERRLAAHHQVAALPVDVLSYHDPRRCPLCAAAEAEA
jgi:hypothetical protein